MLMKIFIVCFLLIGTKQVYGFGYNDCQGYLTMENQTNCGDNGYILSYAIKYCEKFFTPEYYNQFNSAGKTWVQCTGECLITATSIIVNDQIASGNVNCTSIETQAFNKHVDCYLSCGFCNICGKNLGALMSVFNASDFSNPLARQQVIDVMSQCGLKCFNIFG